MSDYSDLLTSGISDIRNDIRNLHGVAADTLVRVAKVEVEVAGLKEAKYRRTHRWALVTGVATIGAGIAKMLPDFLHKG